MFQPLGHRSDDLPLGLAQEARGHVLGTRWDFALRLLLEGALFGGVAAHREGVTASAGYFAEEAQPRFVQAEGLKALKPRSGRQGHNPLS